MNTEVFVSPLRWMRSALALFCILVAAYLATNTAYAIWHYGWSELFQDQYRQYSNLLLRPFPDNVLAPDNSHRQVTTNLIRLADLRIGHGDQRVGLIAGLATIAAVLAWLWIVIWRDRALIWTQRAAAILIATVAITWLGSGRMQIASNDAFQTYIVMGCALTALSLVERLRAQPQWLWIVLASVTGVVATLSFSTGVAVLGLLLVMPVIRHVALRWIVPLAGGVMGVLITTMFLLPGGESLRSVVSLNAPDIVRNAIAIPASFWTTSWLSHTGVGAFGLDSQYLLTMPFGPMVVHSAQAISALIGNPGLIEFAFWIGLVGWIILAMSVIRVWRHPDWLTPTGVMGLGLSVFAAGVSTLVSLGRSELMSQMPSEVLADRYVPWACLFWLGLLLIWIGRTTARWRHGLFFPITALAVTALFVPTQKALYGWASASVRQIEARVAAMQSGIYPEDILAYTDMPNREQLAQALAVFRAHQTALFRTPRSLALGRSIPLTASEHEATASVGGTDSVSEYGPTDDVLPAWHVEGRLLDPALRARVQGVWVVDRSGRVVGLGEFGFRMVRSGWQRIDDVAEGFDAYFRASPPCEGLRLYGVDDDGLSPLFLGNVASCDMQQSGESK